MTRAGDSMMLDPIGKPTIPMAELRGNLGN
jgi:hypothetical protein